MFKNGDRVTCKIEGVEIKDAKISIDKCGEAFICQNIKDGTDADDKLGYRYSWILDKGFTDDDVEDLKFAVKSFDNPQIGDEYLNKKGESRFVLGVCGRAIFLTIINNKNIAGCFVTKEELISNGYTIVQDKVEEEEEEEITEMTVADVEKLVGKKVKIVK